MEKIRYLALFLVVMIGVGCKDNGDDGAVPVALSEGVILAGKDKRVITPPLSQGIKMSGFSARTEPYNGVHDDLYVRSIVISDGNETSVHVSTEQLTLGSDILVEIHTAIRERGLDIPISQLFISATHTHGGPSAVAISHQPTLGYKAYRTERIVASIIAAYQSQIQVKMRVGRTSVSGVNTSRRFFDQDGNCMLGVNLDGNSDKEVQFLELVDLGGRSYASIVLFGVHSTVMGGGNLKITGDIAGYTSRYVEENRGNDHISLWVMSGGGDQSPVFRTQAEAFLNHPIKGPEALGNKLGEGILPAFDSAEFLSRIEIRSDTTFIELRRKTGERDIRAIYGLKFSEDLIFVSTPFELFSSTVQDIKETSLFEHTFILSLTNGVGYYIPPLDTYGFGCYENSTSIFTNTAEGIFRTASKEMLLAMKESD